MEQDQSFIVSLVTYEIFKESFIILIIRPFKSSQVRFLLKYKL
jgi:hypothetical protein